jgi:hypothetical protein
MEDTRDLARTGLTPDALNMTEIDWKQHRLNRIAEHLTAFLATYPEPK